MRRRAWGWLLVLPAVMALVVSTRSPFPSFHQHLGLAGTPDRLAATVVRAGRSDARGALWLDNLFVLAWVAVVPRLLRAGLERWAPERRRMPARWNLGPRVALFAGLADLVQNSVALALVGKQEPATTLTLALTAITWVTWALFAWSLLAVLALVVGPLTAPLVRPALRELFAPLDRLAGTHPPMRGPAAAGSDARSDAGAAVGAPDRSGPSIGICVSGGGGRAASVALGALRRLDEARPDGPSLFLRSRWLVAVGGGAFTAAGWRVARRPGSTVVPSATAARDGAFDADHPWAATISQHRRDLDRGTLSAPGAVAQVLLRSAFVLGGLVSAVYVLGAVTGRSVRTRALHPWFPFADEAGEVSIGWRELVPARLVLPGLLPLVVAGVLALGASASASVEVRRRLAGAATVLAAIGAALLAVLVGVPAGVVHGRALLAELPLGGTAEASAGVIGALVGVGVIVSVVGVLASRRPRWWMRVGSVLLAALALLFAGMVADTFAYGQDGLWSNGALVAVSMLWLVALDAVAAHRLAPGGVYRKRLADSYALDGAAVAPLPVLPSGVEPHWADYEEAAGPELVVAASARCSTRASGGTLACGFTFRPSVITLHDHIERTDRTSASVSAAAYPRGSWWDGFPRAWTVTRSTAFGGVAFARPLGRSAVDTTNSLLVALDLRLGAWVPNPRFAHWFDDPATSPRVHLGYLWKELFGRYHPDRDAFVYVTEGGHRDELGLVELLRERPDVLFCVDANGAAPASSRALAEAVELARAELGVDIELWNVPGDGNVRGDGGDLGGEGVAEGSIRYPAWMGGGVGRLIHGRGVGGSTPCGSVDDRGHDELVALGHGLAERMVQLHDRPSSIGSCV